METKQKYIKLTRADVIEQLTLSLGAFPLPSNFNLVAMAERLANELEQASGNRA